MNIMSLLNNCSKGQWNRSEITQLNQQLLFIMSAEASCRCCQEDYAQDTNWKANMTSQWRGRLSPRSIFQMYLEMCVTEIQSEQENWEEIFSKPRAPRTELFQVSAFGNCNCGAELSRTVSRVATPAHSLCICLHSGNRLTLRTVLTALRCSCRHLVQCVQKA
jgi:hypothetical protein